MQCIRNWLYICILKIVISTYLISITKHYKIDLAGKIINYQTGMQIKSPLEIRCKLILCKDFRIHVTINIRIVKNVHHYKYMLLETVNVIFSYK